MSHSGAPMRNFIVSHLESGSGTILPGPSAEEVVRLYTDTHGLHHLVTVRELGPVREFVPSSDDAFKMVENV